MDEGVLPQRRRIVDPHPGVAELLGQYDEVREVRIKDEAGMEAYGRASAGSIAQGGAAVLAVDTGPQVLEGSWHGNRTVVLAFESV